MKVNSALSILKGKLDQAVASLYRGIAQIENVKTELHAAKSHAGNAGRLMLGKEAKDAPAYDSKRGVLAVIQKMLNKSGAMLNGFSKVTESAMCKIEGLGQRDEKSSVRQSLKEIKSTRTDSKTAMPERDMAR